MLIFQRLRRFVASFSLALIGLAVQSQAVARTEDANFIRFTTTTAADLPVGVRGELLLANDNNIYFASSGGGANSRGFIGKMTLDGTLGTVYSFKTDQSDGSTPYAGVIQATDGNLYGTTFLGGDDGAGVVFKLSLTGQYTLLHSFGENTKSASLPYSGVVQAPDGNLYGTTSRGGLNDNGTIYRISTTGDFSVIHDFDGDDGSTPQGRLIIGADGQIYGTTMIGGSADRGTIYRISTAGVFESLYSFPRLSAFTAGVATNATGANPRAGLLLASDGNYYGTAFQGGPTGHGTVYRMTPAGAVSVVHAFVGPLSAGVRPLASVSQDAAGNLYGTTMGNMDIFATPSNMGSAWRISPSGQFTVLHNFLDLGADGSSPKANLLVVNGGVYGASSTDGGLGSGGLFKLDLGSNNTLPIELSVSPTEIVASINASESATITWSSTNMASCKKLGAWTAGDTTLSGTQVVTPTLPGIYTYVLSCTDGAGVVRGAYTALSVKAPPLETVDGGGGAGALSIPLLLLLAALLFRKNLKEIFTACP